MLVKGEPGTGKTMLAIEVAESLGMRLIEWHIKSTTKASQGLYEYDAVSRLEIHNGDERVKDISNYINKGKLWDAFTADEQVVLLVDEIDKADIEFPMICYRTSRMGYCYELDKPLKLRKGRWLLLPQTMKRFA